MVRAAACVRDRTQMAAKSDSATCRLLSTMSQTLMTTVDSLQPATVLGSGQQMRLELAQDGGHGMGLGRI
jgi:hypothetical protein